MSASLRIEFAPGDTDSMLLEALARVNDIGSRINQLELGDPSILDEILTLVVESALAIVPAAAARIHTYDAGREALVPAARAAAGPRAAELASAAPRSDGLGARAIARRRPALSYEATDIGIHPDVSASGVRVMACLPLIVAAQPLGALYVYLLDERRLSELELLLLDNFVNQAAMAIYHAGRTREVQRSLERKEDELALLRHATLLISSRTQLEDTLEAILQMALEITGARYGIFRLVDASRQNLVMRAIAGERLGRPAVEALPINATSIMGWVAKARVPLNISDVREEPWARIYYPLDHSLQMRSDLAVPLIGAGGRLEGVLNLESAEVGAFSAADSHLLQTLAMQAVLAIQEVRLLDALRETSERLLTQPADEVLSHLVELACDLTNAGFAAVWTRPFMVPAAERSRERDPLVLRAISARYPAQILQEPFETLARRALSTRSTLLYDRSTKPSAGHESEAWSHALAVPVIGATDKAALGALVVHGDPERDELDPSEWDRKVLGILSHYAALALEDATRRRALAEAQEARAVAETFAAMGDVAANLLHHLNNKVGTIPVRVEGIREKCPAALETHPYLASNLSEIERAAWDAMTTVRERLSLLRPIEAAPVALADCLQEALHSLHLADGLQVEVEGLDDLPSVLAGRGSVVLVITNLLENAAAAMGDWGHVHIRGSVEGDWVQLVVEDDGPGIAEELQGRVFEFDYSAGRRPEERPREKGRSKLGFGLWWVRTVMSRLGGTVTLQSDPQQGARFILRFPRVELQDE